MSEYIEQIKLNDKKVLVTIQDETPFCPRAENENLGTMLCYEHNSYIFGDKQTRKIQEVESKLNSDKFISLPLRIYNHSSVSMSTSNAYPYNDYWDSSDAGVIYVSLAKVRKEYSVKKVTQEIRDKVIEVLNGEVEEYSNYLLGNVYRYEIYTYLGDDFENLDLDDDIDCHSDFEFYDSCGGYIMSYSEFVKCVAKENGGEFPT